MKIKSIDFAKGVTAWKDLPADRFPEVAFIGRSNVGKSSLVNMLVGRKALARTSGTPGKTQQFNYYLVNGRLYFVDVPGFGYAKVARTQRERWQRFIGQYVTERETLRLVFQLIDSRHPPTALDREVMVLTKDSPATTVVLLTKSDKLSGNHRGKSIATVEAALAEAGREAPVVLTSAVDKRGRNDVLRWIDTLV